MISNYFAELFEELKEIEKKLEENSNNDKVKEESYNKLLNIRNKVDKCIKYWLKFEELSNDLQEKYDLFLPDDLESLVSAFEEKEEQDFPVKDFSYPIDNKRKISNSSKMFKDNAFLQSFQRGVGFFELSMLDNAIDEFENITAKEPGFIVGHFILALSYAQLEKYKEAEREIELVMAMATDSKIISFAYNVLGCLNADRELFDEALDYFYSSLKADDESKVAYYYIGVIKLKNKNYEESINYFEKAKESFPKQWEIYFQLGKAYTYAGNLKLALKNLLQAKRLNKELYLINFELGVLYDLLGKKEKARQEYHKSIKKSKI